MDILSTILSSLGTWGWIAVIVVILFRPELAMKLIDLFISINPFRKNGNGAAKKLGEIDEHLEVLTSNHISHLQKGIDRLIEMQEKENVTLALMAQSLEDLKDKLK